MIVDTEEINLRMMRDSILFVVELLMITTLLLLINIYDYLKMSSIWVVLINTIYTVLIIVTVLQFIINMKNLIELKRLGRLEKLFDQHNIKLLEAIRKIQQVRRGKERETRINR